MSWLEVLISALDPLVLLYLLGGVAIGMVVGTLPGLTATMTVALLTPLTFWLAPEQGFAMLIGVYKAAIFAGGTTAILINTPGTPASIASTFDGYELTKQGKPGLALGINAIYSFLGNMIGIAILMTIAFPIAEFALQFSSPEYFALAIFGISMMISVSGSSILKGLITGVIGLILATVGLDPMLSIPRFTFDNVHFMEGVSFIPVMIGLFGVGEILNQILTQDKEEKKLKPDLKDLGRVLPTLAEFKRLIPSTIMSGTLSSVIGAIPGAGGDIASIITWDLSKKMSKHPEEFGKGSIEGLASTCTANNGVIGGAFTTMLTLGIPGDAVTAVLIGSLMMYGMRPGPQLFVEEFSFVTSIMIFLVIAAVFTLILGLMGAKLSTLILKIDDEYIWMSVLLLCVVGSYALNSSFYDVLIMTVSGVFGIIFKKMSFPLGPLILGLLLGGLAESNFRRALTVSAGDYAIFYTRWISGILILLTILALITPLIGSLLKRFKSKT